MQPPEASTSKGKASTKANAAAPKTKEKRKLACQACRARRIRCEWPEGGGAGCVACALADLRCPGEPEPRKRQKKGEGGAAADGSPSALATLPLVSAGGTQANMDRFELGGALTFHLIESLFVMANPAIPGLDYWTYRNLLHNAGGSSREMEIAAECLCSAFIASAASFSDHSSIVGAGDAEMPTDLVSGEVATYDTLVPYGSRRRQAVSSLAARSLSMYAESNIKDRPGVETIFTMLALDQSVTLTTDGGRKSRDFILAAIQHFKHLLERIQELPPVQLEFLRGSLGDTLLSLDAQTAAILNTNLAFSPLDLSVFFPHLDFRAIPPTALDLNFLINDEEGWTQMGKQLAPMQRSLAMLYRAYVTTGPASANNSATVESLWAGIDLALTELDRCEKEIATLPSLETKELTDHRQFDLMGLINSHRRTALRLDLLAHQRILDAALEANGSPAPDLLHNYEVSRGRVQRDFVTIAGIARQNVYNRSLLYVRRLFEMLEICSTWTSLRLGESAQTAAELIEELGISRENGQTLIQALSLAAWSSPLAAQQRSALQAGLGYLADQELAQSSTATYPNSLYGASGFDDYGGQFSGQSSYPPAAPQTFSNLRYSSSSHPPAQPNPAQHQQPPQQQQQQQPPLNMYSGTSPAAYFDPNSANGFPGMSGPPVSGGFDPSSLGFSPTTPGNGLEYLTFGDTPGASPGGAAGGPGTPGGWSSFGGQF